MDRCKFFINSRKSLEECFRALNALGFEKSYVVEAKALTRTLKQNAMLHSMFGELEHQAKWNGEKLTSEQWKMLMISAHAIATKEPTKLTIGLEGEIVNLREKSSTMTISRLNSLIEYVMAWGVANGVRFKDE